jgi:hypothetical protein
MRCTLLFVLAMGIVDLSAQSIRAEIHTDFGSGGAGMQRNGTADTSNNYLIPASFYNGGSAYWWQKQDVGGGFSTDFKFTVDRSESADGNYVTGLSFIVQNEGSSALGANQSGLGYDGILNSIAVEFDNYHSSPASNHISIQTRGLLANSVDHANSLGWTSAIPQMAAQTHTGKITYDNNTQRLKVYVDPATFTDPWLDVSVNLNNLLSLDNGKAYVGFTGGSNRGYSMIDDWNYVGQPVPEPDSVIMMLLAAGSLVACRVYRRNKYH